MHKFSLLLLSLFSFSSVALSWNHQQFQEPENYEGSSDLVNLQYHMGPVLAYPINLYIIWYGNWNQSHRAIIKDFIYSISSTAPSPSVSDWWRTVRLYTDETNSNITANIKLSGEFHDTFYSHGTDLRKLTIQSIIKHAALPLNYQNGVYLVLTSADVQVSDFCRAVCGFHHFTFPVIVGATVPYAWVGYSGTQCPGLCAYPFAWPKFLGTPPPSTRNGANNIMRAPNGDPGVDGMINVIAHELAEVSSNPLFNAWYAGDKSAPIGIADLCEGVFGSGAAGELVGEVYKDSRGDVYNVNGVKGRKFLVQWVWDPVKRRCFGPNAIV